MSFSGLLPGDRKYLSELQKKRNEKKKKDKLKIKTSETPPTPGQDKKKTENGKPKYSKGEVAKNLGNALSQAGKKISKAQSEASSSVQRMKDKNRSERNKKKKGYRYGA